MSTQTLVTLSLPDPLALLDATSLFVIQLLIAQHPELLIAPDEAPASFLRPVGHAHLLLTAVRELQYAIEIYRAHLPPAMSPSPADDDIPF